MASSADPRRCAFVSGALRVSTDESSASSGPRSHVLGVMSGLRHAGWDVSNYIAGDLASRRATGAGSLEHLTGSLVNRVVADAGRVAYGSLNARRAERLLPVDVEFVYERFAAMQAIGRRFQRLRRIPWVVETNGPFFYEAKVERASLALQGLARRREASVYRDADLVVCVSDALRDIVCDVAGAVNNVVVVRNGVDTVRFDPTVTSPTRVRSGFTVGYVGSLLAWQGLDRLITALSEVVERGCDIGLTIVGSGPELRSLTELAASLDVTDRVNFVGQVPWGLVPGYVAGFDAGYSGQLSMEIGSMYHSPLKIYEYLAMGKPVVASDFPDARLAVPADGQFLFNPGSVGHLTHALESLWNARDRIGSFQSSLRTAALEHHSWDRRVRDLLDEMDRRGLIRNAVRRLGVSLAGEELT